MQVGFMFPDRVDRNKFETSMYELKMTFEDITRSSDAIVEMGGIHRGDTYSIDLMWNAEDEIDINVLTDLACSYGGTISISTT